MARAVTEIAKAEKSKMILETAYELYKTKLYKEIKMIDIAKACGVSKGTLFNYYATKEALFLEIYSMEIKKRFNTMYKFLNSVERMTLEEFRDFFLGEMESVLDEDSPMVRLSAALNHTLEQNISYETALAFKKELLGYMDHLGSLFEARVPGLFKEDFMALMMVQNSIIIGYKNMSLVPKVMQQVIEDESMEVFRIDFRQNALSTMRTYLDGFLLNKYEDKKHVN
jgi:AcrR family transcriptional regulator